MQFYISLLASITAFGATVNAVGLCTGVNPDGTCTLGTCHTQDIGFGVEQETPGINCIFNTVDDPYVQYLSSEWHLDQESFLAG